MDQMEVDDVMDVDNVGGNVVVSVKKEDDTLPANRAILKAKRRLITIPNSVPVATETLTVIDTNIFIHHLSDLKQIFACVSRNRNKHCVLFVVPMIVIQELDGLKKGSSSNVQRAITFINEQLETRLFLSSDVSLIKKYRENSQVKAVDQENKDIDVHNNDDVIIEKCLLLKKLSESSRSQIILLTNDVNLQNKALAVDLRAFSWKKFTEQFFPSKICDNEQSTRVSSQQVRLFSRSPRKRKISTNDSGSPLVPKIGKHSLKRSVKIMNSSNEVKHNEAYVDSKLKKFDAVNDKEMDGIDWLTYKYESEKKLSDFIELLLKREYGDKLWDKMFQINPKNASLFDLFRLLKQGWIGTFSDPFDRNPKVQELIDKMLQSLKDNSSEEELKCQLCTFMKYVPSMSQKCDS